MFFILVHLNLGLSSVLTLQDEFSLTQPTIVGLATIGFQQLASTFTGLMEHH